jgi:hypothetical protein
MENNNRLKIFGYWIFFFLSIISQISCKEENIFEDIFTGYNDLLDNSPMLLWGSSKQEVKYKYSNVEETGNEFFEYNLNGKIKFRVFYFVDNKLYFVGVSYGEYNNDELDLLRSKIQKNFGIILLEDNGTIESWYIEDNENNAIVFTINKLRNNTVNCSYINPILRDMN